VRPQKNIIRKFLLNIFRANNTEEMNGFETFTANQHRPEGWFLLKMILRAESLCAEMHLSLPSLPVDGLF